MTAALVYLAWSFLAFTIWLGLLGFVIALVRNAA